MFWLYLLIRFGLPLARKLGWIDEGEKLLVEAWYVAKKIKFYSPKDIQTPDAQPVAGTNLVSGGYTDRGPRSM